MTRYKNYRASQRGIALIMSILIAAIITAAAVVLAKTQQQGMGRTNNYLMASRSDLSLHALKDIVSEQLLNDLAVGMTDSLADVWVEPLTATYNGQTIRATLEDLQAGLNVNSLANNLGAGTASNGAANGVEIGRSADLREASLPDNGITPADVDAPIAPGDVFSSQQKFSSARARSKTNTAGALKCGEEACPEHLAIPYEWGNLALQTQPDVDTSAASTDPESDDLQALAPQRIDDSPNDESAPPINPGQAAAAKRNTRISLSEINEARFRMLLKNLDIDASITQAIMDWMDPDSETRYPNGAEDEYYTNLKPAYRAANAPFTTLRELMLVRGVTAEIFEKLAPHIYTLTTTTDINVNTASIETLMSLSPFIDRSTAEMLVAARNIQAFQSVSAFLGHPLMIGRNVEQTGLSVGTKYFRMTADISDGNFQQNLTAVISRADNTVQWLRTERGFLK